MNVLKSIIIASALLFANSFAANANTNSTEVVAENEVTVTIKVKGVGCQNDCKDIAGSIEKVDGVLECKIGKMGAVTTFEVKYDSSKVDEKTIHTAIENTGGCHDPNSRPYSVKQ